MKEPTNSNATAQAMPIVTSINDNPAAQPATNIVTTDSAAAANPAEMVNTTTTTATADKPQTPAAAQNKTVTTASAKTNVAEKLKAKNKAVAPVAPKTQTDNNQAEVQKEETPQNTNNTLAEEAPQQNTATPEEMRLLGEEPAPERAAAPAAMGNSMNFSEKIYEFGTIPMGEVVSHNFSFTNKATIPLVIYEATSTCGCTIPDYPKEPIMPGTNGTIKVTYDSKGKIGTQNKEVTIRTNSGVYKINMKGMVVPQNFMPDKKEEQK